MAWSEPLAIVLGTGVLVLVARHIETRRTWLLALAAIGLGLAALSRYAAVAYAMAGALGLILLDPATPLLRRVGRAVALASLAAVPLLLWWLRTGARIGLADRTLAYYPLTSWDWEKATTAIIGWAAPLDMFSQAGGALVLLVAATVVIWAFR